MRLFKKKITEEEFRKFEKRIKRNFQKVKKDNRELENRLTVLTKVTMGLCPLSKQFTELRNQFTELVKQFTSGSLNRDKAEDKKPLTIKKRVIHTEIINKQSGHLTQLEQKGLIFIGRLQNESGSHMIPVGMLTSNLYPDKLNQKIKTTVSNILKKHVELGMIMRERRGNYWYIGLTSKGYKAIKKLLHQNQLKNLIQLYEK